MLIAAALYAVTVVAPPRGSVVDLVRGECTNIVWGKSVRPPTIALARNGAVAIVVHPPRYPKCWRDRIAVVRANGSRVTLEPPSDAVAMRTFPIFGGGLGPARVAKVALAGDGTPFITLSFQYSGGSMGIEEAIFGWTGTAWVRRQPPAVPVDKEMRSNAALAAVDTPSRLAYVTNYGNFVGWDSYRVHTEPHYRIDVSGMLVGNRPFELGAGDATAVRGAYVAGYVKPVGDTRPKAVRWAGRRRTTFGTGVAWGVNSRGDAVGDDRANIDVLAHPMLWTAGGRAVRLSGGQGSAWAIGDDGTIVGTVDGHGVLIRGGDPVRRVVRLDALVRGGWSIDAAYGIAANGRILAVGSRRGGPVALLVLDPVRAR